MITERLLRWRHDETLTDAIRGGNLFRLLRLLRAAEAVAER